MACVLVSAIFCVFHLLYQVFDGIGICNICNNKEICYLVNRSLHTVCSAL